MVLGAIDMVDPNRIYSKISHESGIASALLRVDKGIIRSELIGDTLEEVLCFDMVSRSILRRLL